MKHQCPEDDDLFISPSVGLPERITMLSGNMSETRPLWRMVLFLIALAEGLPLNRKLRIRPLASQGGWRQPTRGVNLDIHLIADPQDKSARIL